jgi:hypothetical protein
MIFINCIKEALVQVNDKTRIDVSMSFVSGDGITDITINPDGFGPISVFDVDQSKWYLDWAFDIDGTRSIEIEATDGINTIIQTFEIEVISPENDNLFSNDSQIFAIESELKRYIPEGRNSFKNIHREAQSRILNFLDRKRIWNENGEPYTKMQVNLFDELSKWSLYETLFIIYTDLFISVGDKFAEKVNQYKELRNYERERAAIRIDKDGNGTFEPDKEIQELKSFRMIKR